jgi:hypothetical protein
LNSRFSGRRGSAAAFCVLAPLNGALRAPLNGALRRR